MFPVDIPPFVQENPLRSAECKVFARLRHLPAGFTVYYSRPWLGLTPEGKEIDGEADFVIAHPQHGLLVIEVKGGGISYDARLDRWTSTDRHAIPHPIKNPVEQARRSKHQLLEKLKAIPSLKGTFIPTTHAVVFPDAVEPPTDLSAEMPRRIFACREDMGRLAEWVVERIQHDHTVSSTPGLGEQGITALDSLIAHNFQLRSPLAGAFGVDERRIITLTEQQYDVLDGFEHSKRCVISGGAGTGKTLLAVEKAKRLAAAGYRTLLTCYNQPLAAFLKGAGAGRANLEVRTYHELCGVLAREAHVIVSPQPLNAPLNGSKAEFFESKLTAALLEALDLLPAERLFDAIIVDEGQDFLPDWLISLEMCLRRPDDGFFYVFFDDNQRCYNRESQHLSSATEYTLTRNLRNTKTICAEALPFYSGKLRAGGPDGRIVDWIETDLGMAEKEKLIELVERLTGPEEVAPHDIAILSRTMPPKEFSVGQKIGRFPLVRADQQQANTVVFDSVARFKGLEKPVVILLNPGSMVDSPELLYVAITRARVHLILLGSSDELDLVKSLSRGPRSCSQ